MSEPNTTNEATEADAGEATTSVVWVTDDPHAGDLAGQSERPGDVTLRRVADGERALDAIDRTTDCVVTDVPVPGLQWNTFVTGVPEETPVVLYTDRDPTKIPEEILTDADSLVQQGGADHQQFLCTKIRGVTTPTGQPQRRTDVEKLATERVDGLASFLVDDDGTVVWASDDFDAVFPETDTPSTEGFYERLAAVLADQPAAVSKLLELRESRDRREGTILPISLDSGGRRDVVHCSYPLPERVDAARLELFEDVTVGHERTERLELFETLVMGAQDGLYTLDANGTIEFCNPAMADQLGYTREELLGMHASEVMAEGELERGQREIQKLVADPDRESTVHDMTFVTKRGEERVVSLHVQLLPSPDNSYAGLVGVMRDVTARKERQRELERYETIIQALGDPVYAVDENGDIIYVNEAFEEQTGYDATEVIGERGPIVLSDESYARMEDVVRDLLEEPGASETVELEVVTKAGDRYPAEVHTALLPPHDGEYHGNAGVLRDVTERKRRENRLEEFTSVVAHDLRGPLGVGKGNLDLYRETGEDARLEKVADAFEEMEQLIDDLLELAKHGEIIGETEPVDLESTIRDAWQQHQTDDATLVCEGLGTIQADRDRLRQALENLFGNSVEHGSTGNRTKSDDSVEHGSMGNRTKSDDSVEHGSTSSRPQADDAVEPCSTGSQTQSDDAVEHGGSTVTVTVEGLDDGFAIEDDGPGIPEKHQDSVFERGFTTTDEGTGFGLAIVGEIVEAHGWTIQATTGEDGGARFEITGLDTE